MGLDMSLYKKHYVKNWKHEGKEKHKTFTAKEGGKKMQEINTKRIIYITEEVMDWRKANAIHEWFNKNVASGELENSKEYYVDRDDLKKLLATCEAVLTASKLVKGKIANGQRYENGAWVDNLEDGEYIEDTSIAEKLLPTQSGFFYGSTNYDQWYIEDVKRTAEVLRAELTGEEDGGEYYYYANW
jgi:hypothetical protein